MDNTKEIVLEPEIEDITCDVPVEPSVETDTCVIDEPVQDITNEQPQITTGTFFGTLQEAVVGVWKFHLSTNKHFEHVELDRTYNILLSYVDSLVEMYQGILGNVLDKNEYVNVVSYTDCDCKTYLNNLRAFVIQGKETLFATLSEMCSKIDDIIELLDTTIYKLNTFQEPVVQTFESFCYSHQYDDLNESCCDDENDDEEEE